MSELISNPFADLSIQDFICFNLIKMVNRRIIKILETINKENRMTRVQFHDLINTVKPSTVNGNLCNLRNTGIISEEKTYFKLTKKGKVLANAIQNHPLPENFKSSLFFQDLRKFIILLRIKQSGKIEIKNFLEKNPDLLDASYVKRVVKYLNEKGLISCEKKTSSKTKNWEYLTITSNGSRIIDLFAFIRENLDFSDYESEMYLSYSQQSMWFDLTKLKTWEKIWLCTIFRGETQGIKNAYKKLSLYNRSIEELKSFLSKSKLVDSGDMGSYSTDDNANFLESLKKLFD
ncbi:MAG: hypothetical protein ACTSUE_01970, partial [Promethearchaeota archaeon]